MVTPGFIDGHTHMDAQVFWDPMGTCSCWHGVTTVVMGNCGFTLAPAHSDNRALVVRNLERAEDISPAAMAAGIDWTWETFAEYLDAVDRAPKGINYAANIGHSALRTWAMGERAFERGRHRRRPGVMGRELRRRAAGRGHRVHHLAQHRPRDLRRPAGGLPAGDVGRGAPAGRRDGRPGRRACSSWRPSAIGGRAPTTSTERDAATWRSTSGVQLALAGRADPRARTASLRARSTRPRPPAGGSSG